MRNLLSKFRRKKPVPPPTRPIAPYRFGYDLMYYRSHPGWVDDAREIMRGPVMQRMMSVLQHEIPLDSIDAVRGYRQAMRILELMATQMDAPKSEIEATFGAEEEPEQPES
jgi:hypothetical protein